MADNAEKTGTKDDQHPDMIQLQAMRYEAHYVSRDWREESWRDCEMYDGDKAQWTYEDWQDALDKGITPITINRTFPTLNLLFGMERLNKHNITAKARTKKDSEISQTMTESIQFVMDQNMGEFLVSAAADDGFKAGIGWIHVGLNRDPRKEKLGLFYRDWKDMFWDPYSDPWVNPTKCRYMFYSPWTDFDLLKRFYPGKEKDLEDEKSRLTNNAGSIAGGGLDEFALWDDESTQVEEERRLLGGNWVDIARNRVRPVEMWYPRYEEGSWAVFPDGRAIEITDKIPLNETILIYQNMSELVKTVVPKMYYHVFLGDVTLAKGPTPMGHDDYPFVPFVGYIDRFRFPYGVPRQIRGQDIEVNKRRSTALALLNAKRMKTELGAWPDRNELQKAWDEAQSVNPLVIVPDGMMEKVLIEDQPEMAKSQIDLMYVSEREIHEIAGPNRPSMGFEKKRMSGVALQEEKESSQVITTPLFTNIKRSKHIMGEQTKANIQRHWKGPKVLRVTDRISGAERFLEINQKIMKDGQVIEVRNDLTQGRYDTVITEAPMTDTVREKFMMLVIEWVKKSPPEIIPQLMHVAFELSNLPNKDALMARIRPILGIEPGEEDMSPQEIKEKVLKELEAQREQAQKQAQMAEQGQMLDLKLKDAEVKETEAKAKEHLAKAREHLANADKAREEIKTDKAETAAKVIESNAKAREYDAKVIDIKRGEKSSE